MRLRLMIIGIIMASFALPSWSQEKKREHFDPARFQAEMEQFIATHAGLTAPESEKFFPLFRELKKKQMAIMIKERRNRKFDINDDKKCAEAIRQHDQNDIETKELIQQYHNKFMKILPASKVFKIIVAEEEFHRHAFRMATNNQRHKGPKHSENEQKPATRKR